MKDLGILQHPDFGTVRTVSVKNEPWFRGKDICEVLGLTNHNKTLSRLDEDERQGVTISDPLGGTQTAIFINESGLYSLILQSRKPQARAFKKWVTSEVLPSIRKYGYYVAPGSELSRKERNALERAYHKELRKYITTEDIYKVAKKMRRTEDYVESVLRGGFRDNDVMRVLQTRALANKDKWEDAYAPAHMDEILSLLK